MTEAEWLTVTDPKLMLDFLRGKASDRKLRLFAVACCRRGRSILRSKAASNALGALEAYADNLIPPRVMEEQRAAWHHRFDYPFPISGTWSSALASATMMHTKVWARETSDNAAGAAKNPEKERAIQAHFLRELFGNTLSPVTFDPSWLTSTVTALASQMYESRDFSAMPILADALQDAGCDNEDVLNHCRQSGEHVKGCWVVDLLLGKS